MKRILSAVTAAALVISLTSCSQPEAVASADNSTMSSSAVSSAAEDSNDESIWESYSFEDDMGNTVSLEKKPEKIAVLFSSYTQMWKDAGGDVAVTVGDSVSRGFVNEDDVILVADGAGKTIDTETLIASEPDLVICTADISGQQEAADLLSKDTDIPTAGFTVESFEDYLRVFRIMTDITGDSDAYEEKGVKVGEKIKELLSGVDSSSGDAPRILFIRAGSGYDSTKAKTAEDNFACAMLKELGTYNVAEDAPLLLDGISMESILEADPEYIFFSIMGEEAAGQAYIDSLIESEEWQALSAVQNDKIVVLPKDYFHYKPNLNWYEAYKYLYDILYK